MAADDEEEERLFGRIDEALQLILNCDPLRFSRLRADVKGILVAGLDSAMEGYWVQPAKMCVLTKQFVDSPDVETAELACAIVHETTHARLHRAGIRYDTVSRDRVERLCVKAELVFALKIPGASDLVERIQRRLVESRFTLTGPERRQLRLRALRKLGVPGWIIATLAKWYGRRAA